MATESLVVAVDDEPGILKLIRLELSDKGYRVVTASNGEDALQIIEHQRPDVVILDVLMPDMNGYEVMRRIRERTNTPVILLTARDRDEDKVRGLDLGADDYLPKPFNPEELSARVKAVLRRSAMAGNAQAVLRIDDIEIDLAARMLRKDGHPVDLTRTEWMLLQHLAANSGKVIFNKELLTKVWGPEYTNDLQYLRVWISRLRSKVEADPGNPKIIKTLQGIGYLLDPTAGEPEASTEEGEGLVSVG
jgi:two-component system, OmpR family, KDP operon response regulator KdpE